MTKNAYEEGYMSANFRSDANHMIEFNFECNDAFYTREVQALLWKIFNYVQNNNGKISEQKRIKRRLEQNRRKNVKFFWENIGCI